MTRIRAAAVAFLAAVATAGCSTSPTAELNIGGELTGVVSLGSSPLPGGKITLWPETGRNSMSQNLGPKGEYKFMDPPLGPCKVTIETAYLKGTPQPPKAGVKGKEGSSAGMVLPTDVGLKFVPIPAKYEKPETTDLMVTVGPGSQKEDFKLDAK